MLDAQKIEQMWDCFNNLGQKALAMSHYELGSFIDTQRFDSSEWREFLMLPEVDEHIRNESAMLQSIELRKLLSNISSSRSVGQAQLVNSLQKLVDGDSNRNGPIFIYTYIPLNDAQQYAANVQAEEKDVFWRG